MDAHGPGTVRASHVLVLLASFSDAYQRGDWTELRSFYHEDALLCTQAAYQRVVGPDEVVSIFADLEDTAYSLGQTTSVDIDQHVAPASAQLRYPLEHGGMRRPPVLGDHLQGRPGLPHLLLPLRGRSPHRLRRARPRPRHPRADVGHVVDGLS